MSAGGAAPEAVTFDYWNTLCCEPPGGYLRARRLEAMRQMLVDAGVGSAGVVLPILTAAYDAAWLRWNDSWRANRRFTGVDAARSIADALERKSPDLERSLRARIFEHALEGLGRPNPARCVHIGDRRRTDVVGAQALGRGGAPAGAALRPLSRVRKRNTLR